MKTFLSIFGGLLLVLVLVLAGVFGYAHYRSETLYVAGEAYIKANIPPIISTWSKNELLKRSSPKLLKALNATPDELNHVFHDFSRLGALQTFGNVVRGGVGLDYDGSADVSYTVHAKFENGEASIGITLTYVSAQWQISDFSVDPVYSAELRTERACQARSACPPLSVALMHAYATQTLWMRS